MLKRINKKSQLSTMIFAFVILFLVILVGAIIGPFGAVFSSDLYSAGEDIILMANESIQNINDPAVRAEIEESLQSGLDATQDNISVSTALYKYSWIIAVIIFGLIWFLQARRNVQTQGGFA